MALLDAGNAAAAEQRLREMLAINPHDARALALIVYCRLQIDDAKGALDVARNAASINPDDWMVRRALLSALMRNDKTKEASPLAASLAADDPDNSSLLYSLAVARWNAKDYHGANELFERAAEHADGEATDLLRIAYLKLHQWNWDEAKAYAKRALMLDPTHPQIFFVLAECALGRNQPRDAYDLALEALRLDPQDRATYRLLTRARARFTDWLKPFVPGIDWLVEMNRVGAALLALTLIPLSVIFLAALIQDIARINAGMTPALVISLGSFGLLVYAGVCYATAFHARLRIRRDLKRIALPNF